MFEVRRNHGQCKIIQNDRNYVLVGLGEDISYKDIFNFEVYDINNKIWKKLIYQFPIPLCWPGFVQISPINFIILGGWDNNKNDRVSSA